MKLFDREDWGSWFNKLKWQLISFKFISFWTAIILLVAAWISLDTLQDKTVTTAKELYKQEYITKDNVTTLITHSQTVLYDAALSHILIFAAACITGILAIRGVSYYTDHQERREVIKKLNGDATKEDLKKFLPKKR